MNHVHAILNVLEILEIEKDTAKKMFEHYVSEFLQLVVGGDSAVISEEDLRLMQEVALSLGLTEKEFKDILEDSGEKGEQDSDEYDAQLDNYPNSADATSFSSYLNKWVKPENTHDDRYLF